MRSLCLAQGIPASVIDSYTFPTTATAGRTQGNLGLGPEIADTYNFGLSWTSQSESPLLSGASASVDYYNITIEAGHLGGAGPFRAQQVLQPGRLQSRLRCDERVLPAAAARLERTAAGHQHAVPESRRPEDAGHRPAVRLEHGLENLGLERIGGKMFVNTGVGYLMKYSVQTLPGTAFQEFDGTNTIAANHTVSNSFPKWKALTTLGYSKGGATVSVRWRYQNAMADVTSVTTPANPGVGVSAYNLVDLFASYDFNDKWQIRAGVTNVARRGLGARFELANEHRHGSVRCSRAFVLHGVAGGPIGAGTRCPGSTVRRCSGNELRLRCRPA